MKIFNLLLYSLILFFISNDGSAKETKDFIFESKKSDIPQDIQRNMQKYTWRPGCPVPLIDLKYLNLSYYGFDKKTHKGDLIVHKDLADEVIAIFKDLYEQKFSIEKMQLMNDFKGDDDLAMLANNTSAFNCRSITGKPGVFSLHSYGRAIDINTKINPYVKGKIVLPKNGKPYVDRSIPAIGKIIFGDATYQAFLKRGWTWGGDWISDKDYQHFEKKSAKNKVTKSP